MGPCHSTSLNYRPLIFCLAIGACGSATFPIQPTEGLAGFEAQLDSLRVFLEIPGMSAAIVKDERTVWARGFGYADLANERLATPSTSFHVASLTKTFASVIIMRLVEEGRMSLDDPVSDYGVDLPNADAILVRHLMTHTSEGSPGAAFSYNGNRFGELGKVIEEASGRSFADLLVETILRPLNLSNTAPNVRDGDSFGLTGLDRDDFRANMATGYEVVDGGVQRKEYPSIFNPAGGLISSTDINR